MVFECAKMLSWQYELPTKLPLESPPYPPPLRKKKRFKEYELSHKAEGCLQNGEVRHLKCRPDNNPILISHTHTPGCPCIDILKPGSINHTRGAWLLPSFTRFFFFWNYYLQPKVISVNKHTLNYALMNDYPWASGCRWVPNLRAQDQHLPPENQGTKQG